jgi:hypothetical protein
VEIGPEVLRWAIERSGLPREALRKRFPSLADWESGAAKPTSRQLGEFAVATRTPLGYLFLQEPPAANWSRKPMRFAALRARHSPVVISMQGAGTRSRNAAPPATNVS